MGDADAVGDLVRDGAAPVCADLRGEVRVSIAGKMSPGAGPGKAPGDEAALEDDPGGDVPEGTDADSAGEDVEAFGWSWAADGCLTAPARAKLTAADAARTLAATPATASGRHQRRRGTRFRPDDAGLDVRYPANAPMAASGSQSVAGRIAATSASRSSAVGRSPGSLARQCRISGRRPAGT